MAGITAMVVGGVLLAGAAYGGVKQAEEARKMRKNAEAGAAQQYRQQRELIDLEKDKSRKLDEDRANETARVVGNQMRDAGRARAGIMSNRQGINTSSLGVTGQASTASKTALGT